MVSEPGRGADFRIRFPAGREHAAGAPSRGRSTAGNRSILLVEDEDSVRRLAAQVLRMEGYQVSEARSGDEALDLLGRDPRPVDLVLTDVVMPNMGGWELSRRLKELRPEGVPGHSTFIRKPFTVAGLVSGVRAALGSSART